MQDTTEYFYGNKCRSLQLSAPDWTNTFFKGFPVLLPLEWSLKHRGNRESSQLNSEWLRQNEARQRGRDSRISSWCTKHRKRQSYRNAASIFPFLCYCISYGNTTGITQKNLRTVLKSSRPQIFRTSQRVSVGQKLLRKTSDIFI